MKEKLLNKAAIISMSMILLASVLASTLSAQTKTTSLLWGEDGELWDSRGRLPDFSYAGYGGGYAVKPSFTNTIDVTTQGVIPNDGLSDVAAINSIISSAPDNSVVYFPAGRYVLDDWVKINRSNIVLKGEGDGANGTVFFMPKSATEINGGTAEAGYNTGGAGQIVEFRGNGSLTTITEVSEIALRTDRVIEVLNASNLNQGDIIVINARGDNPVNRELWYEYFNNQTMDWPEPHVTWATGDNVFLTHTIEKIEGNLVTLREPLRLKLKPSWGMKVRKLNGALTNVAIEDIRFEFNLIAVPGHLQEPGYNAVQFENCQNFWSKNLTIQNCDNGINIRTSSYGEIEDTNMIGRMGHHGFDIAHSSNNIITDITFDNNDAFFHSITINHKANGNVISNVKGTQLVRLDNHRNVPFSNLWTDVKADKWNHRSSGDRKAGPHAGGWNVYWGLSGESTALYSGDINDWKEHWGIYAGTLVSGLDSDTSEMFTEEREWYENIPYEDLADKDLYKLQKEYRAGHTPVV
ncbi:MAG: glycosyl hydrolase family 28-related protein, partial [Leeuwenhoekiella sp.]